MLKSTPLIRLKLARQERLVRRPLICLNRPKTVKIVRPHPAKGV